MKEYDGFVNTEYSDKPFCIYKIISSDESDKSIYIGTTSNYDQRAYRHARNRKSKTYKQYPLYEWINDVIENKKLKILFIVIEKDYNENDAFNREVELIKMYKELGYNVLNNTEGGKGPTGHVPWNKGLKMPDEIVEKYRISHIGKGGSMKNKHHSEKSKQLISLRNKERADGGWVSPKAKKVYKYSSNGKLLSTYASVTEAGKIEGVWPSSIGDWCRGDKRPRNDYKWSYKEL